MAKSSAGSRFVPGMSGRCGAGNSFGAKVVLTTGFDKNEIFRIETSKLLPAGDYGLSDEYTESV